MSFFKGLLIGLILAIFLPVLGIFVAIPILLILFIAAAFGPILLIIFLFFPNALLGEFLKFGFGLLIGIFIGLGILALLGLMHLVWGAA